MSSLTVEDVLQRGTDAVAIGRCHLHHDFPTLCRNDGFSCRSLPVSVETLLEEGLSVKIFDYMRRWNNFVSSDL